MFVVLNNPAEFVEDFHRGLIRFQGWRLGKYCAGIGASTIIQYKCKTTTVSPAKTTTTTASTTTTMAPCVVEEVAIKLIEF